MNRERLLDLADFLSGPRLQKVMSDEAVKNGRSSSFEMEEWLFRGHEGTFPCGTTACAIGWATMEYPGLHKLVNKRGWTVGAQLWLGMTDTPRASSTFIHFFMPGSYEITDDPKVVADRIREYLEESL